MTVCAVFKALMWATAWSETNFWRAFLQQTQSKKTLRSTSQTRTTQILTKPDVSEVTPSPTQPWPNPESSN